MKYKFINEYQVEEWKKGNFIVFNGNIITNPTEESLTKAGYKDMTVEEEPEYDRVTEYLQPKYTDGDVITKSWEVKSNIPTEG